MPGCSQLCLRRKLVGTAEQPLNLVHELINVFDRVAERFVIPVDLDEQQLFLQRVRHSHGETPIVAGRPGMLWHERLNRGLR
jgi:hypothetical protein